MNRKPIANGQGAEAFLSYTVERDGAGFIARNRITQATARGDTARAALLALLDKDGVP